MKSLQEHLIESLTEAKMVEEISWGDTEYGYDVVACLMDKNGNPIKFDEKKMNKIIKDGKVSHNDEKVIKQIFDTFPEAQSIYFSYYNPYDEDEHEYGYWDKDEMNKGMQ